MFKSDTYIQRRKDLVKHLGSGIALFLGNDESPMNYKDNTYHFRQDSSFLYFFGVDRPGLGAIIDVDSDQTIIFGDEHTIDDIVWMGSVPSIADQASHVGVKTVLPLEKLVGTLGQALSKKQSIHYLPPYRQDNAIKLHKLLDKKLPDIANDWSPSLVKAVISLRAHKTDEEIQQIEKALRITKDMHLAAIGLAKDGLTEAHLTGAAHGVSTTANVALAYPMILTVNGQTLHNHFHGNTLKKGQLVLADLGAESPLHYASDITRTFPVAKTFTNQQKEVYEIVLKSQLLAIDMLKPGVRYRDVHLSACRIITEGLKSLGLMKGDTDEAIKNGAHAMFFPHGLGHMIGLDVHDMEDLGEKLVGYDSKTERSDQFGLKSLRLARELEAGHVLTVEPGIYFIPELIDRWQAENRCAEFIDFEKLKAYRNFGGIRIEDDCVMTQNGGRVLGEPIPKSIAEIEALRN
ncbi:MAG: aminopeptidase P family protein [Bdellovibrionales bacterium]|nr:aminopeptidase P family protein [Bdellovibrionales bacterium]